MLFRDLSQGDIFEVLSSSGNVFAAIKTEERFSIRLDTGEEVKIHANKKVDFPKAIQPGEYAQDINGEALLVEEIPGDRFRCDYILRLKRGVLNDKQVVKFDRSKGEMRENRNEVYITLKRAEKALEDAQTLLKTVKVILDDL